MPNLGKIFVAALFGSCLITLPAAAGAAESPPPPEPKAGATPLKDAVGQPAPPTTATPAQTTSEPAKAERPFVIGFADMLRIGSESAEGKAVQARLKGKKDKLQAQISGRKKQLERQKSAIEAQLATLTPQQRGAKAKEFEKKIVEYQRFVQTAEKELQEMQEELTRKLFQEIEQVVSAYGKANGYAAIIVKKELLYLDGNVKTTDVTDEILKRVNEKEKGRKQ